MTRFSRYRLHWGWEGGRQGIIDRISRARDVTEAEAKRLSKGQLLISFFWPGQNEALMELAKSKGANVIAMDMVPRISRAQKMDALSSMANIAGYRAERRGHVGFHLQSAACPFGRLDHCPRGHLFRL